MDSEELLKIIDDATDKNLTKLDLFADELTQLPPEIGNLTKLKKLHIFSNKLTQLPSEIGKLTNLTELNLPHLTRLPPEIGNLTKLSILRFGFSNIEDPQKTFREIIFANSKKSQIIDGELVLTIEIQRNLRKYEFTKITKWLKIFKMRACFAVDKDTPDIKLSRKNKDAIYEIKQYLCNKYQDHISQVYDQKTQTEK